MEFYSWQNKYAIGIESIDSDHKILVEMINDLYIAMSKGKGREVIAETIERLVGYAKTHFRREELFLKRINYKNFMQHEAEHDKFIEKVVQFQKRYHNGKANLTIDVATFLREWLSGHILNTDKAFVAEMKKHNIN